MRNMKEQISLGMKEGWSIFWLPLTSLYATSKKVILAEQGASSVKHQFALGMREGWAVFWSPFSVSFQAIKTVFSKK